MQYKGTPGCKHPCRLAHGASHATSLRLIGANICPKVVENAGKCIASVDQVCRDKLL